MVIDLEQLFQEIEVQHNLELHLVEEQEVIIEMVFLAEAQIQIDLVIVEVEVIVHRQLLDLAEIVALAILEVGIQDQAVVRVQAVHVLKVLQDQLVVQHQDHLQDLVVQVLDHRILDHLLQEVVVREVVAREVVVLQDLQELQEVDHVEAEEEDK